MTTVHSLQLLITNSLVTCNRLMRWCPAPDCGNAVRVGSAAMQGPNSIEKDLA